MKARAAEQYERLRRQGRLELRADRRPLVWAWAVMAICVVLAACLTLAVLTSESSVADPGAVAVLAFWVPFLLLPGLAPLVITWRVARRRQALVVDAAGIEEWATRHGRRERVAHYPWSEVELVRMVRGRHPRVGLQLTPSGHQRVLAQYSAMGGRMMRLADVLGPRLVLLSDYEGGPKVTVELLQQAHRDVTGRS
ncbi:hypothetical protein EDD41_1274 [Luteococcus japonicus]|uniref:Uncharacterized protein n=1 Tax=Luteococcus japonicus TaxID=33984 RepID=A0A3N1ZTB8_9ACTN|nr:hypothetical protein [Luteococcus japonicus]ROR54089.1 hypothetical protein EDD41_1274 [Luteococcus japonicus]